MIDGYMDHCDFALDAFGKYVFGTLSTESHFYEFVADHKSMEVEDSLVALSYRQRMVLPPYVQGLSYHNCIDPAHGNTYQ